MVWAGIWYQIIQTISPYNDSLTVNWDTTRGAGCRYPQGWGQPSVTAGQLQGGAQVFYSQSSQMAQWTSLAMMDLPFTTLNTWSA